MQARRIIQEESETFKIFSDLYYKRINVLDELNFKGKNLAKLGVSQTKTDDAKELNDLGQSSWWWNSGTVRFNNLFKIYLRIF